ncbi:MAG: hypothetical protein LLG06_13435 [Desulfobacteraceae bacterium]|nr:hypothetical protein [Desulfobacteraceae bacterium]
MQRLTQKELAACFGITDRAIRDWEGCPRNKDDTYNLPEVIKWRISKAQDEMAGLNMSNPESSEWLDEFRKERVLISRIEREQLERRLGPVEEWGRALTDRAFELSRRLLLMSRRIAHRIAAVSQKTQQEVTAIVDDEIRQAMNDYARPIDLQYEPLRK